jgi:hypothetical protein
LVAEFVHRMNEEMSGFLFEADAAHEKTIDFFERLQSMPELMEVIQALRPGTEGKNYFVLACFTFLAAGQFTLNRQPLDLDKWAKILRPNLAERRSLKRDCLPFDESDASDSFQVTTAGQIRPRTLSFPTPIRRSGLTLPEIPRPRQPRLARPGLPCPIKGCDCPARVSARSATPHPPSGASCRVLTNTSCHIFV